MEEKKMTTKKSIFDKIKHQRELFVSAGYREKSVLENAVSVTLEMETPDHLVFCITAENGNSVLFDDRTGKYCG